MEINITGQLTNISGSLSPDLQCPRASPIQKKLLYYSWDGLGGVETRKREEEHAVKRHKPPKCPWPGESSVSTMLEVRWKSIFSFKQCYCCSISIFILARILSQFGVAFLGTRLYSIDSQVYFPDMQIIFAGRSILIIQAN
jgi:hypothetical protein